MRNISLTCYISEGALFVFPTCFFSVCTTPPHSPTETFLLRQISKAHGSLPKFAAVHRWFFSTRLHVFFFYYSSFIFMNIFFFCYSLYGLPRLATFALSASFFCNAAPPSFFRLISRWRQLRYKRMSHSIKSECFTLIRLTQIHSIVFVHIFFVLTKRCENFSNSLADVKRTRYIKEINISIMSEVFPGEGKTFT